MARGRWWATFAGVAVTSQLVVGANGIGGAAPVEPATRALAAESVTDVVELLPLHTAGGRFVDADGRDVILRGANVNSLGEYWQGVPTIEPTLPVTDADWAAMAARGFSVVRLLVTWSRVEPVQGTYDEAYLDTVEGAVDAAAAHGIYSVIDMHQDAYTAFLSTTDPSTCPAGTSPAKGWDGAPAWAVKSDGLSTCLTNRERNSSPAVNRAWNNFYDNRDGIRDAFAAMWGVVAERFAGHPEVAGFDLLNEPETSRPASELSAAYNDLLGDVIRSIRAAQAGAPFDTIVIVEPAIPSADVSRGLMIPDPAAAGVSTENVAAGVHNYAESIDGGLGLTIEGTNRLIAGITADLGIPNWGGEYGWWDTSAASLAEARRYAVDEDRYAWGGAWWQWRQSCGDPHHVQWSGGTVVAPADVSTHLNKLQCPDNTELGQTDEFLDILGRGYPRATPGTIDELRSDPATGYLKVKATVGVAGGELVVWTPTTADPEHQVNVHGLTDVVEHEVEGGRIITARVGAPGTYALWIGEPDEDLTATTTTGTLPSDSPAPEPPSAVPVAGDAGYTG